MIDKCGLVITQHLDIRRNLACLHMRFRYLTFSIHCRSIYSGNMYEWSVDSIGNATGICIESVYFKSYAEVLTFVQNRANK